MPNLDTYVVACCDCQASFDAAQSSWCNCLVTERSLVCPHCLHCFCKAAPEYKRKFWTNAPKTFWSWKFEEHHSEFLPPVNPEPEACKRPLVLLVDDEKDIQRAATRAIESLGYGMVLARNGAEGLELAKRYRPNLVLSDALMPQMDGREMCRQLKADPETKDIKVAVMTSLYTGIKYRNEAFKAFKVDDYISKPIDFNELRTLLEKHLG